MQRVHRIFLTAVVFLVAIPVVRLLAWKIPAVPMTPMAVMEQIAPEEAMPGEVVTATGYGLEQANVRQVYLIFGKSEYRVDILEQSSAALRFRVPVDLPPGAMRLATMVAGRAELVEQPVVLMVLEGMMTVAR